MKIIFIGHSGYQYPHVRIRCYHFASVLKKMGMETEVLSFKDHLLPPQYSEETMYALRDRRKIQLTLKAFLRLLGEKGNIFYVQKLLFHAAIPFLLSRLGRNRYILDCDDWDAQYGTLYKSRELNRFFFDIPARSDSYGNIAPEDYNKVLMKYAGEALGCVVSSHSLLDIMSKVNDRTFYVPTGVDDEKFNNNSTKKDGNTITFSWTGIVWGEVIFDNMLFLLHCFSALRSKYPNIRLKILGGGQYMGRVKQVVESVYNNDGIEVLGTIKADEVPQFLSGIDIGVVPLIQANDLWVNSKSPTKLFEFMASGKPVIASRTGENVYVIDDGKDGFLASGKDEFLKKMEMLITDEKLRKDMGEKAREKIVNNYSLNVLGKKLYSVISELKELA